MVYVILNQTILLVVMMYSHEYSNGRRILSYSSVFHSSILGICCSGFNQVDMKAKINACFSI